MTDPGAEGLLRDVCERFGLGELVRAQERHGGVNRLWRVTAAAGEFSVHELLGLTGDASLARCQSVFDLERAASAAGVRVAEPIASADGPAAVVGSAGHPLIVHRWVAAEPVDPDRAAGSFYGLLGRSVARVHRLDADVVVTADLLATRVDADEWRALAAEGRAQGLRWADVVAEAADELAAAVGILDQWEDEARDPIVVGHRDLTSENVLDDAGDPVLIDWEDAGPIRTGVEIGRTALDNLSLRGDVDAPKLAAYLAGYREVAPLPDVGPHWCSLWLRGLVVYAYYCAQQCLAGTAPGSLLRQQAEVVEFAVPELRRRFTLVDSLVEAFAAAARA